MLTLTSSGVEGDGFAIPLDRVRVASGVVIEVAELRAGDGVLRIAIDNVPQRLHLCLVQDRRRRRPAADPDGADCCGAACDCRHGGARRHGGLLAPDDPAGNEAEKHSGDRKHNRFKFHRVRTDDHSSVRLNQSTSAPIESGSRASSAVPCATASVSRTSRVPGPMVLSWRTDRHAYGSFVLPTSSAGLAAYFFIAASVRKPV